MQKKLTLEIIKLRLKEINPNIEILNTEYINQKTKLRCKCLKDEHEWEATWVNLSVGKGCPKCASVARVKQQSLTIEEIKERLLKINPNIKVLSDEYINSHTKLKCKCLIDGYEFQTAWGSLSQGVGCKICAINSREQKQRLSIQKIKEKLKEIDSNIEILSNEYKNNKSKLKCRCKIDGYEWNTTWMSLQQGCGCPMCSINSKKGESNINWKGGITPLHNYLRHVITPWKIDSFTKYNNMCDITGIKSNENIIHHSIGFSAILKETMTRLNLPIYQQINQYTSLELKSIEKLCLKLHYHYGLGICLCKYEHDLFHKIYGKGDNTKKQYEEFKKNRLDKLNETSLYTHTG